LKTATDEEKIGIMYSTMAGEYKFIFEEFGNGFIENSDNPIINAHYVSDFCINETLNFFINVIEQNCVDESHRDYFNKAIEKCFERLDCIDNEFRECISKLPDNNLSISEFPKGADDEEKNILNKTARAHLIERNLSTNGKYDMTQRRLGKKIARFLISHGVKDPWGVIIMNKYINHDVERATLVNYFNECPKDMPMKNV
jgi:hypothetical protein